MSFWLLQVIFSNITKMSKVLENKKIVVFGTGKAGIITGEILNTFGYYYYYADNNNSSWGTTLLGKKIYPPEKILKEDNIVVLIASSFFEEISKQLSEYGINDCDNLWNVLEPVEKRFIVEKEFEQIQQNKNMMTINNSYSFATCPVCRNSKMRFEGCIHYGSDVLFASCNVELLKTPELWKCERCLSRFVQNTISPEVAALLYKESYAMERWVNLFEDGSSVEILKKMEQYFVNDAKILDVGCNDGALLDSAKVRGCITSGVEVSKASRELLAEKGHVSYANIEEAEGIYDVITAFDLIEHLYDIPAFLDQCWSRLIDKGVLVILTGDILCMSSKLAKSDWWYLNYPEHIVFPSEYFFKSLLNFRMIECWSVYDTYTDTTQLTCHDAWEIFKRKLVYKNYSGKPSCGSDHVLIILQKK